MSKICSKCLETKLLTEFGNKGSYKRSACKKCSLKASRIWRADSIERVKEYRRNPNNRFSNAKSAAKFRNKSFNLTKQDYLNLISNPCFYCCKSLQNEAGYSLDRINNDLGYELSNLVPCCGSCNQIKGANLTINEMQAAMVAVLAVRALKANKTA